MRRQDSFLDTSLRALTNTTNKSQLSRDISLDPIFPRHSLDRQNNLKAAADLEIPSLKEREGEREREREREREKGRKRERENERKERERERERGKERTREREKERNI